MNDHDDDAPEALVISSLLDTGEFEPGRYRVTESDLSCWQPVWRFCADYQQRANEAPPVHLVLKKFPDFAYVQGVDPSWSASQLRKARTMRDLRKGMRTAAEAVRNDDLDSALSALAEVTTPTWSAKEPVSVLDYATIPTETGPKIPVPYRSLQRVTGGIAQGDLWYYAGRPGTGKSWEMTHFAATAMLAGVTVRYISLEMPMAVIARRIQLHLVGRDRVMLEAIRGNDMVARRRVLDALDGTIDGKLTIVDPSFGKATTEMVSAAASEVELVIVDHVGLLQHGGGRVVDDWRAMASASNMLKEVALSTGCAVLGAAQLNRDAEGGANATAPPKLSQLSQSDALGQDADVVVSLRQLSARVRNQGAIKVREGPTIAWKTRFDPYEMRFEEISDDAAQRLIDSDGAKNNAVFV